MAESVFFWRGEQPFTELAGGGGAFASPDFIEVTRVVLRLNDQQLRLIAQKLGEQTAFVEPMTELAPLVATVLNDEHKSESVATAILNIDNLYRRLRDSYKDDAERFLDDFVTKVRADISQARKEKKKDLLTDEEITEFRKRAGILFKVNSPLGRQAKAMRLARSLGKKLEEFRTICDIRPVFDDRTPKIVGMFPATMLKLIVTGETGLPEALEIYVTESQLITMYQLLDRTLTKLKLIRTMLESNNIPVPTLGPHPSAVEGENEDEEKDA